MGRKIVIVLLLVAASFTATSQGAGVRGLLPDLSDLPGWQLARDPAVYSGDQLFDLIDGGADLFFEYHFQSVVSAVYSDTKGNKLQVEIYQMDSDSSAYGIFSSIYNSSEVKNASGCLTVEDAHYVSVFKGRYYINIAWILKTEAKPEALSDFAGEIVQNIDDTWQLPFLVRQAQGIPHRGIPVFFMGNIALSNVYYFDYKDPFQVEQGVVLKDDKSLKIIFLYSNKEVSAAVFSRLHDFIEGSKRFSQREMIYQGYTCLDNKGNRLAFRQGSGYIAVTVALKSDVPLLPLMDEFDNGLEETLIAR